jgi:toxin ParE1/3/4
VADVRVSPQATEEVLDQTAYYHRQGSPQTADRWADQTRVTFQFLAANPEIGAPWSARGRPSLAGVRTWPVDGFKNFLVFYRPVEGGIEVLHVLRGSRDLPGIV